MKTTTNTKKSIITACIAAAIAFSVSSCSKDNSSTTSTPVTEADAAQVTTDAVSPSSGGMVGQVNSAASLYSGSTVTGGTVNSVNNNKLTLYSTLTCGSEKDSTITYASLAGATPSFNYALTWKLTLQCTVPSTLGLTFNGSGSYSGAVLSSSFTSTGGFTLTGLSASTAQYTFSSTYGRTGTTTSNVGNKNTFNHSLTITSSNILYDKATQEIVSGTATVAIKLTSTSGAVYNYGGTLTFLGNKTAKLVLNSGTVYNLSWS